MTSVTDLIVFYHCVQPTVEEVLEIIIVVCIVWILIPKPLILLAMHKVKQVKEQVALMTDIPVHDCGFIGVIY
jgi:TRAP-type C4-dicarboxylate transport system permease small subunit